MWGAVCFLNAASVSLSLPLPPPPPARACLRVFGGGKARVFAKLTTCLCAKLTGGRTTTPTPRTASRPLCWRPRSPALGPCRPPPRPTPTPPAPAPLSTPEPLRPPPACRRSLASRPWRLLGQPLRPPRGPRQLGDSPPVSRGPTLPRATPSLPSRQLGAGSVRAVGLRRAPGGGEAGPERRAQWGGALRERAHAPVIVFFFARER